MVLEVTYSYADSRGWGDLLTSYDGRSFQYDEIGNLLSDGEWTYTWAKGRQLVSMTKPGSTLTFTYDADGNRITKTVNGTTTTYTYVDGRVTHETNDTDTIHYRYDTNGTLLSMNLNGTEYYYLYNGQRDVIGLYDASGKVVVEYTYDAWGKTLTTTGSLAGTIGVKNPYRYRSYRYDAESGLYALQSRYYNPQIGRFFNADDAFYEQNGLLRCNLFTYCINSPIGNNDLGGNFAVTASVIIGVSLIAVEVVAAAIILGIAIYQICQEVKAYAPAIKAVVETAIVYTTTLAEQRAQTYLEAELDIACAKASAKEEVRNKNGEGDRHHIVAKSDPRAAVSRAIINSVGIDTNSRDNLVNIDKRYHQVIHTTTYHTAVTIMFASSYVRGKVTGTEEKTVTNTLRTIKTIIQNHSPRRGVPCRLTR